MATWQFELLFMPTSVVDISEVKRDISSFIPQALGWSDVILIWGEIDGHRIELCDDGLSPELLVRIDLRNAPSDFIREILSFARHWRYEIKTEEGQVVPLTMEGIAGAIERSDAFRFVFNPQQFLDSLRTRVPCD